MDGEYRRRDILQFIVLLFIVVFISICGIRLKDQDFPESQKMAFTLSVERSLASL